MSLQIWLAILSVFGLGLAAFTLFAAKKARDHRMATDRRLDQLGRELFDKTAALDRRCDELVAAVTRLEALGSRLRLLELERELARLGASGRLTDAARERLETAIASLRADLGGAGEAV